MAAGRGAEGGAVDGCSTQRKREKEERRGVPYPGLRLTAACLMYVYETLYIKQRAIINGLKSVATRFNRGYASAPK